MRTSESIKNISAALLKAQTEMGNATKDSKNPFFKSSYATLNAVREAVTPALNSNGIAVLQPQVESNGKNYVETVLLHSSGEYITGMTEVVYAKAGDPQGQGSGISYARRYGLQSMLSIGAEDDDGEAAMGRSKPSFASKATVIAATTNKEEAMPVKAEMPDLTKPKSTFRKPPSDKPSVVDVSSNDGEWQN